jgi:hypothetical protein
MLFVPKPEIALGALADAVKEATAPSRALFYNAIEGIYGYRARKVEGIERLIEAEAWCDAVMALIRIALPLWDIRRLVCENGEWFCSLTRQPNLPLDLDDTADARHNVLSLAILGAVLEAWQKTGARDTGLPKMPEIRPLPANAICCDNFG